MPAVIDSLRQDHCNIEELLQVLEQECAVFDRADRPDFDILGGLVDYFRAYPKRCHQPKEALVFTTLKARVPERTAAIIEVEAEHAQAAQQLERFANLIEDVLNEQIVSRQAFDAAVREFLGHERHHMEVEERELLPAALASLTPADWAAIEAKLADASLETEAGLEELRQRIVRFEREDQAERACINQGRC